MGQVAKLAKGQKVSCGKNSASGTVVLKWDSNGYKGDFDLELDVSAFVLYQDGKVKNDDDFIFYNNTKSVDGSIEMLSSERGKAQININFQKIRSDISRIAITLTIYDAEKRKQNFSQVSSIIASLALESKEVANFAVQKMDFKVETAIVVCEIYKYKDEWKFSAIGAGYRNGLDALCKAYGIQTVQEATTTLQGGKTNKNPKKAPKKEKVSKVSPVLSKSEALSLSDDIMRIWSNMERVTIENNEYIEQAVEDDPEILNLIIFVSILYWSGNIKLERDLKNKFIKKVMSKSNKVTGMETVSKEDLHEILEEALEKIVFLEIQLGRKKTDAACLYSTVIEAFGKWFLRATVEITEEAVSSYLDVKNILGNYNKKNAVDILDAKTDVSAIKKLDDWYDEFIASGELFVEEEVSLEELLEELEELTGLQAVKSDISSLINMVKIQQLRKERNLPVTPMSLHLVFSGNPGTGKTTVARLIAKIYKAMGLLKKGHLVEVDRSKLVAGYVGQTAIKVSEAVESAIGGVLFIDEAYTLTLNKGGNDFGQEAVDTLLKAMEDRREEFIVIVAGYNNEMQQFVLSNPGLQSRFNKYIFFEDYVPQELLSIFTGMCQKSGMMISRDAEKYVSSFFVERYNNRGRNYANARDVRNFYEKMLVSQANRLSLKSDLSDEDLLYIRYEDVSAVEL